MKVLYIMALAILLAYWPIEGQTPVAQAAEYASVPESSGAAPVSQPLVREGDFAVKLAQALHIVTTDDEAEAESVLSQAGIAPQNGWIADYPMTPDILMELRQDTLRAADAGKLALGEDQALRAIQTVADGFGLFVQINEPGDDNPISQPPPGSTETYVNPTVVNNYYYEYGPPVVTYYAPPPDYYYLYAWVPFPFWWYGFYYPGFFVLHDFDRVVVFHRGYARRLTNHVFDHRTRGYFVLDRHGRHFFDRNAGHFNHAAGRFRSRGFESPAARRGAESILRGRVERSPRLGGGVPPRAGLREGRFRGRELHRGGPPVASKGFRGESHGRTFHSGEVPGAFRGGELHGGGSPGRSERFRGELQGRGLHGGGPQGAFRGNEPHGGRSPGAFQGGSRGNEFHGGMASGAFQGRSHWGGSHSRGFSGAFGRGGGFRSGFHGGSGFGGGGFRGGFRGGGGFHGGGGRR
jgi:hypothetical protein